MSLDLSRAAELAAALGLAWEADGEAVRHRPSGLRLRLVPAGRLRFQGRIELELPSFLMGEVPVTQGAWDLVARGFGPSAARSFVGAARPMEGVSWRAARDWVGLAGDGLRLPSEVEWEYACRAGSEGAWCFGDDAAALPRYAWFDASAGGETRDVGQLAPNAFGLYDMHGNVWEWCQDGWVDDEDLRPRDALPAIGWRSQRVLRGGSYRNVAVRTTSARRLRGEEDWVGPGLGLRVARDLPAGWR